MRATGCVLVLLLLCAGGTARRSKKKAAAPAAAAAAAFRDPNEAIGAATAAQVAGNLEEAYKILDEAIKSSPKVFSPYFAKAQMMCKADDYRGCKEHYTKGIELAPPAHRGLFSQNIALELGQAAYRMGQSSGTNQPKRGDAPTKSAPGLRNAYKTALSELETALSLSEGTPSWVRALYTKGQVHEAVAKAEQGGWANSESAPLSIAAWKEVADRLAASSTLAAELTGIHADCHTNLGVSFERLDRLAEAEEQFRAALALQPEHQVAYGHLRDTVDWQHPDDPSQWQAVAQEAVDRGIWERIDQTPAMRYHKGVKTTPWPDVSRYPTVAATIAAMEAATDDIRTEMRSIMDVEGKKKRPFLAPFYTKKRSFYQDWLGTKQRKVEKRGGFCKCECTRQGWSAFRGNGSARDDGRAGARTRWMARDDR
jgi:tetratricopeptide (TPR) repeat protein